MSRRLSKLWSDENKDMKKKRHVLGIGFAFTPSPKHILLLASWGFGNQIPKDLRTKTLPRGKKIRLVAEVL